MFCKTLKGIVLVYGVVALAGLVDVCVASADAKKDKAALAGEWVRKEGEIKIAFDGKGVMKLYPHGSNINFAILFDYTVEKGKQLQVKVTNFEGDEKHIEKVKELIPVGLEFRFQWAVKDKTATLGEIKGKEEVIGHLKMLEGDYEMK